MSQLQKTLRTTLTRYPKRASYDRDTILEILKEGLVCHISIVHEGQPLTLPNLYGVQDDTIYIHGSVGSFLQRALAKEIDLCFSVTLIDGLVLARSIFNHSVNYRSVVLFGRARVVEDREEKIKAAEILTEHIIPGRWNEARQPNKSELMKTMILAIPIEEASAKIRTGPVGDDEDDYNLDVWAGVIPLRIIAGQPEPDAMLKDGIRIPDYIANYTRSS